MRCHWYMIPEETVVRRQSHNLRRKLFRTNQSSDIEHSFKRIADINDDDDEEENNGRTEKDEELKISKDTGCETYDNSENEEDVAAESTSRKHPTQELVLNSRKGRAFGIHKIGIKKIPEHVRRHNQTELEKAKATLLLATLPKSLPRRNKEMDEITSFIKGAICGEQCLGRCLYIHGVSGTGKMDNS
ncbi:uncharacterized protein A4U43_C04F22000 [Asparagus officinalis]|uniref:Origin recognition complex subunit 1 n=1 Tax=Asparagus officinalis TaxID=4686 RepID=A0A5P1F4L9_ASPOF|nr:uncharacterized protein A4U43_C04F22000 [Asparagus officinalis]